MDGKSLVLCACGCGEMLIPFDSRGRPRRFIYTHSNRLQTNTLVVLPCDNCGKPLKRANWQREKLEMQFCNPKCQGDWRARTGALSGENNGYYNTITVSCSGGCGAQVSKAASLINRRNGRVYCPNCIQFVRRGRKGFYVGYPKAFSSTLRTAIRKRDNYTCQECGKHQSETGTLHIHHIDYSKDNSEPMNLISLCRVCHGLTNYGIDEWRTKFQALMLLRFS